MRNGTAFYVAMLTSTLAAVPALAAGEVCLQNNRILSTKVIDASTILITDISRKEYTVHMRGVCVGLNETAENLSFRTKTELGCLTRGDSISYNLPGERARIAVRPQTQTPCIVDTVTEGAPPARAK
jgi:hypothetical protein